MRVFIRALAVVLLACLVLASLEVAHPRGLGGVWDSMTSSEPEAPAASAPVQGTPAPDAPAVLPAPAAVYGPGAATTLATAERDYDRGDFDGAFATFLASRVLAANAEERRQAERGLERATLAWALVRQPDRVTGKSADLEAQWAAKAAALESAPTEQGWLDAARWAAGAGLRERLPYAVGQALDAARPGGFVQAALEDAGNAAGSRADWLAAGMRTRGLAATPSPATAAPAPSIPDRTAPKADDGPSGIGGINERGIPFGKFSSATRERLRKAVALQKKGTAEYQNATPDSPDRGTHRDTALQCLKEARDIYVAAQAEDDDSRDLEERLKETMLMIAQLKKDAGIGLR